VNRHKSGLAAAAVSNSCNASPRCDCPLFTASTPRVKWARNELGCARRLASISARESAQFQRITQDFIQVARQLEGLHSTNLVLLDHTVVPAVAPGVQGGHIVKVYQGPIMAREGQRLQAFLRTGRRLLGVAHQA